MVQSMVIAGLGIVGMMLVWVAVQSIWRKVFAEHISEEDVLADRRSCGNCGCAQPCDPDRRPGNWRLKTQVGAKPLGH